MLNSLYIASPGADEIERVFSADERFFTVGSNGGPRVWEEINALCPRLLVLDSVLQGQDGAALLEGMEAGMPVPPRVVYLARTPILPETRVDRACPYPCPEERLLSLAAQAALQPVPVLAGRWEKDRYEIAQALLEGLAMPKSLKGWAYLRDAAALCACAPSLLQGMTLYPLIAERHGATPASVEKAIRTAIEHTWLKGSLKEIQRLFGLSVDADRGKPTNRECMAMLSEHVRRELRRRMEKQT